MTRHLRLLFYALSLLCSCLVSDVDAVDQKVLDLEHRRGYAKGDPVPVSCLNRTIDTGEHIEDDHGNLQYIPFMTCNETRAPLSFSFNQPTTQNCTIADFSDELYHLFEYFVHSDVPLSCRVPSYPLATSSAFSASSVSDNEKWTPFTIALQGTLQKSHLHLQTYINALFHTAPDDTSALGTKKRKPKKTPQTSHLIASTAYSLPAPRVPVTAQSTSQATDLDLEGTKVLHNEPLTLTFNIGWIEGAVLPGMAGKPIMKVTDHNVGFSLLSFFAIFGAAGIGALGMLVYERRKSGRSMSGLLPMSGPANGAATRGSGYGGYGGYGGYNSGKRD